MQLDSIIFWIWFCSESVGTTRTPSCCPAPSDDAEGRLCNSIPTWSGASWLRKKKQCKTASLSLPCPQSCEFDIIIYYIILYNSYIWRIALNTILYNAFLSGIFSATRLLLGMRPNAMQRSKSQGCDLLLVPFQIPWNYFVEWCHDMHFRHSTRVLLRYRIAHH